jgi:hypothetical protein
MFVTTYYVKIWQNFAPKNNTAFMHPQNKTFWNTSLKGLKSCIELYP